MPKLLCANEKYGGRITIILDNIDTCTLIVSKSAVVVRSYRPGIGNLLLSPWFSAILYDRTLDQAAKDAIRLAMQYPASNQSLLFRNTVLTAFANAIWHCRTAVEVMKVLNE